MPARLGGPTAVEVDVLLSVHNGMPFLPDQIRSIQAQTVGNWRLWIRDDASVDASAEVIRSIAETDSRIRVVDAMDERLGASRSFGLLMEVVRGRAGYVMLCDADDVWLPDRIRISLDAMREAELTVAGPVLVHTDLIVVDAELNVISDSFWTYQGLRPDRASLRDLLVRSTVTGPTVTMNRQLCELIPPIPAEAIYQDWWIALVAACFGRIVSLPERTVLYRQHGGNNEGATAQGAKGLRPVARRAWRALRDPARLHAGLVRTAAQAGALLRRYEGALTPDQQSLLARYARIAESTALRRKLSTFQLASVPEHSWARNLARAIRA